MKKRGISYTLQGDYYLPDLVLSAEKENRSVVIWGQRNLRYLKQHCKVFYTNLLTSRKLKSYLANIDEQEMNNIRNAAREIVYAEIDLQITFLFLEKLLSSDGSFSFWVV